MKKLLCLLLACCFYASAQVPTTPKGLFIPTRGTVNWDTNINANFSLLDSLLTGVAACAPGTPAITYYNGTASFCDGNASLDGNGNFAAVTGTFTGAVTAASFATTGSGFFYTFKTQAAPTDPSTSGFALWYVDSSTSRWTCRLFGGVNCNPLPNGTVPAGDLTGSYPSPTLVASGVTPGSCGDATHSCQITFDAKGRATSQAQVVITAGSTPAIPFVAVGVGTIPGGFIASSNLTFLFSFVPHGNLTSTQVSYNVNTADNTANLYDVGVYDDAGTRVCHTGAVAGTTIAPSTGNKTIAWAASCSILAGRLYFFALTGNSNTFRIGGTLGVFGLYCGVSPSSGGATTGGVLNATIVDPTTGVAGSCTVPTAVIW